MDESFRSVSNGCSRETGARTVKRRHIDASAPAVLVVGCAGQARVVIDIIEASGEYRIAGLIDSFKHPGTELAGHQVIGTEQDIPMLLEAGVASFAAIAIGDNWTRAQMVARIRKLAPDLKFITPVHPDASVALDVEIGQGTVIMAGAVVVTGATIGEFCILNTRCSVDHDCRLGDYSSMAPAAATGGNVTVGEYSAIAIGAIVVNDVRIGESVVIGAGATVVKDIPDRVVAYGTPARAIRSREPADPYLQSRRSGTDLSTSISTHASVPSNVRLLTADDPEWSGYLSAVRHDFFHTRAYHEIWTQLRGGTGYLAVYSRGDKTVVWPYVLSPIVSRDGGDNKANDITSTYGYSGPLMTASAADDTVLMKDAWSAFSEIWRSQSGVSVFTRFHPILRNQCWVESVAGSASSEGVGGTFAQGKTVALDLALSEEEMWDGYKRQLKQSIRRAEESGIRIVHDPEWRYAEDFMRLYYATMKRNDAQNFYYFPATFLNNMKSVAPDHVSLMVALHQERAVSVALLIEFGSIVNVFLLGTDFEYQKLSPTKLLFHRTQSWARSRGNTFVHLGGGRGCRDDDELFRFKCLFSNTLFPFYTGRWILDEGQYTRLVEEHRRQASLASEDSPLNTDFFPAYRAPLRMH